MAKQGNAWKFSRVICINFLLIFVLTNQNEATNEVNTEIKEYVLGDEMERLELNLYSNDTTYSFRLSQGPSKFCQNAKSNENDCLPKLSLSLLKMQCNNSTDNDVHMNITSKENSTRLCMNYTYLYSNVYEAMHKNLKAFKNVEDGFNITTMGAWSTNSSYASILVSIHYLLISRASCPSNQYFDCSDNCKQTTVDEVGGNNEGLDADDSFSPHNSICIPYDWICDKRPNCGLCGDADESESLCYWSTNGEEFGVSVQYSVIVLSMVISFMITPVLVLVLVGRLSARMCRTLRRDVPFPSRASSVANVRDEEEPATGSGRINRAMSKDSLELPPSYIEVITRSARTMPTNGPTEIPTTAVTNIQNV